MEKAPASDPPPDAVVQTSLQVDMAMFEDDAPPPREQPPTGWLGRLVGNARTIGAKAVETVGETVLTVRERIHAEASASAAASAPAAAPGADGAEGQRFKGLFGRVAADGEHASAAELGERLNWVSAPRDLELRSHIPPPRHPSVLTRSAAPAPPHVQGVRGLALRSASAVGLVASHTRVLASELRQKAQATAQSTRARLAAHGEAHEQTVTFSSRFGEHGGARALAELENSSVNQLERMRALQAEEVGRGRVDAPFMLLHSMLDLPMHIDGEVRANCGQPRRGAARRAQLRLRPLRPQAPPARPPARPVCSAQGFSEPHEPADLLSSAALSASSARAVSALQGIRARFVAKVGALASEHLSAHAEDLGQQPAPAAAEGSPAAHEPSAEATEPRALSRAAADAACAAIDRLSDASLHALAELSACAVKAMLEMERELSSPPDAASTAQDVLANGVPARAAAVRCARAPSRGGARARKRSRTILKPLAAPLRCPARAHARHIPLGSGSWRARR